MTVAPLYASAVAKALCFAASPPGIYPTVHTVDGKGPDGRASVRKPALSLTVCNVVLAYRTRRPSAPTAQIHLVDAAPSRRAKQANAKSRRPQRGSDGFFFMVCVQMLRETASQKEVSASKTPTVNR